MLKIFSSKNKTVEAKKEEEDDEDDDGIDSSTFHEGAKLEAMLA